MERNKYTILSGDEETAVYHLEAPSDGPTAVVVGGIHGDERAGIQAAELVRLWTVSKGDIVVIPRANKRACVAGEREAPGESDLNRKFPTDSQPEGQVATAIWDEITRHNPDYVFDLHRSDGVYEREPSGVGMAIFPTPSGRGIAKSSLGHLNADHVPDGKPVFRIGNDQGGYNPLLSHKVGGELDPPTIGWLIETTRHDQEMSTRVTQLEHAVETLLYHADSGSGITVSDYGHDDRETILDEYEGESDSGGGGNNNNNDMLSHETPLEGFHPRIGGSADPNGETHGGTAVDRPADMPTKTDATHVVSTASGLAQAASDDDSVIYIDENTSGGTIDITDVAPIELADNVTIVGHFCDPSVPGRGVEIVLNENIRYGFRSSHGEAPSLFGVSLRGPNQGGEYFDPDHTADDFPDKHSSGIWVYDDDSFEVIGCEFRWFTVAGAEFGAKSYTTDVTFRRSSLHHNNMNHLGYGAEQYNGHAHFEDCFFDACRHGISSYGNPQASWKAVDCVVGPNGGSGHAFDMHGRGGEHDDGRPIAGEFIRMKNCTMMITSDRSGGGQEALAIRGRSNKQSWARKNHFYGPKPEPTGSQGDAYRQVAPDGWENFTPEDNHFGESKKDGYGAPLEPEEPEEPEKPEEPEPTTMKLEIHGRYTRDRKRRGDYRIDVWGDVSQLPGNQPTESVSDNGDGTMTIKGNASHGIDRFELSDDAYLLSYAAEEPFDLRLDDEPVDLAPLIAPAQWGKNAGGGGGSDSSDSKAIEDLKRRVESLSNKIDSATVTFGGGK